MPHARISATVDGILENVLTWREKPPAPPPLSMAIPVAIEEGTECATGGCGCDHDHQHLGGLAKIWQGLRYAVVDIWGDLAGWFFVGIAVAALITVLIPEDLMPRHLGGGIGSMLLVLVVGIPMYICATALTPIAAALILKGAPPGAALVFLLAGPATNMAALAVLVRILGKKGGVVYLATMSCVSVLCGLLLDGLMRPWGFRRQPPSARWPKPFPNG